MKNILTILFFLSKIYLLHAQTIWFVQQSATGTNSGTSWSNAFTDLQTALATANNGDAIWVAKGTYTPTNSNDQTISFRMRNGVKMYGGFGGSETTLSERNWTQNTTILSGNIGAVDTRLDNSLHVVTAFSVNSNSVLDGFTISDGYNTDDLGGGMLVSDAIGTIPTEPVIENCTFEYNHAYSGGGMYIAGNATAAFTKPKIKNCLFQYNSAVATGGAMDQSAASLPNDTFLLDQCAFINNRTGTQLNSFGYTSAIYLSNLYNSVMKLNRCTFEQDSSLNGTAIGCLPVPNATLVLDSCMFKHNVGYYHRNRMLSCGASYFLGDTFRLFIRHSIFEQNILYLPYLTNLIGDSDFAAITISGGTEGAVYVKIDNSHFIKCGTAIRLSGVEKSTLELTIDNSSFIQNGECLFISMDKTLNKSNATITNCLFVKNRSCIQASQHKEENFINTTVRNCTFFQGKNAILAKRTYPSYLLETDSTFNNRMFIENCIIWKTNIIAPNYLFSNFNPALPLPLYANNGAGFKVKHSLLPFNISDTTTFLDAGQFYEGNIFAKYPEFMDTLADDYRLKPCSPLINKGNNASVLANGILYDLDGLPRILQDTVDMGAYEQSIICTSSTHNYAKKDIPLVISPNPSENGELCIHIDDTDLTHGQLTVHNTFGNVIYRQKNTLSEGNHCLPLQQLPSGIYFVSFETANAVYVGKWLNFRG